MKALQKKTAVEKRKSSIGNIKKSANMGTRSIGEKPVFSERKKERRKGRRRLFALAENFLPATGSKN